MGKHNVSKWWQDWEAKFKLIFADPIKALITSYSWTNEKSSTSHAWDTQKTILFTALSLEGEKVKQKQRTSI
jgi:hypothetical protein